MTRWVAFAALTLLVLAVLLFSARASARVVDELAATDSHNRTGMDRLPDGADHLDAIDVPSPSTPQVSNRALLANVALSHGLFAAVLLVGIVLANVPLSSLGIGDGGLSGGAAVGVGVATGLALAAVNTATGAIADAFDADPSGPLRELLAPDSCVGWIALLVVVLPIIAGFEELLFRAVLIGAFSVGFDLSPWLLAVVSSVAFAAGHGAQGWLGIVATGVLGFVLAAIFVLTGSLLVVAVAHYVVNAVEFVVMEGFEYEPFGD